MFKKKFKCSDLARQCREGCTTAFRTKYLKRKHYKIFMLFSQVFSSRSFM